MMTFAEKLQDSRKRAGLSQEQLAEKLSVSRSAVAKWENDNGMPDIDNLKAIAQLLDVSIDYLLDDGGTLAFDVMREPVDINAFEKSKKRKSRYDTAVLSKFSDADSIIPLWRQKSSINGNMPSNGYCLLFLVCLILWIRWKMAVTITWSNKKTISIWSM